MELELGTPLLVAFLMGGLHVLEPVHGRSIFHAILVGSSKSVWRVIRFGAAVTISHILTAILLALAAVLLSHQFGYEQLSRGGQIFGVTLSLGIGFGMLYNSLRKQAQKKASDCHCSCHHVAAVDDGTEHTPADAHDHHHDHDNHDDGHHHDHGTGSATLLGISGGLIPCSSSIAILMLSISTGKIALGLAAMLVFGLGLGVTLTVVGMITVYTSHLLSFLDSKRYQRIMVYTPAIVIILTSVISLILILFYPE